jgi:hypothetical protein
MDPGALDDLLPGGMGDDLSDMDLSALLELLTRDGGFDPRDLADLLGEQGGEAADMLRQLLGGGADLNDLLSRVNASDLMNMLNGGERPRRDRDDRGAGRRGGRRGPRGGDDTDGAAEDGGRESFRDRIERRRSGADGGESDTNSNEEER